ncbi:MAG: amidohydrolase, partial [Acidobacteriota bacterium]
MDLKIAAKEKLDQIRERIIALSHRIHANPEPGFGEVQASGWVVKFLSEEGFQVETGVCGLPTAFTARSGDGPLHVAICAEYDALPEIGHACGHNIIAASAVGAAVAAARVADAAGLTVHVLGTPGEEAGDAGGKILMLEQGAFTNMHAAMMVHPAPSDNSRPNIIAASMFEIAYSGKEAH